MEGSRILRMNGKSTKNVEKIASRAESGCLRDVTLKNLENRTKNRPKIVDNRLSERLGRPLGSPEAPEKPDFPTNPEFPRHADAGMADP